MGFSRAKVKRHNDSDQQVAARDIDFLNRQDGNSAALLCYAFFHFGARMKNALFRIALGMSVSVLMFGLWRGGVWIDSLMTMRTPLYFTFHSWASMIVCPCLGVLAGVLYDQ